ncbi:MAG TPA: diguanylate cyclase [candidate division Zixibacteria bacterium]|nr:diguanylate cyclase [candidate division Zixibacteria bacterium]HBZ00054.1 diguanylate cyclase [candidate division Zixibacteria bacterium]
MTTDNWINHAAIAITVTDASGIITEMNLTSSATFAADGGSKLVGSNVLTCHPEPSRTKLASMYKTRQPNHYTIRKNGQKKIIHQIPLFKEGVFQGYAEISIPIPDHLPHFDRN